jgi:hypothetical protein
MQLQLFSWEGPYQQTSVCVVWEGPDKYQSVCVCVCVYVCGVTAWELLLL